MTKLNIIWIGFWCMAVLQVSSVVPTFARTPQEATANTRSIARQYEEKGLAFYRQHNYSEALKWYTKAAEMGDDGAQTALGHLYAYGQGVKQDYKQAYYWWSKAADQHNSVAEHNIAALYARGAGVPQNYNRVADCLYLAAKDGNVQAMYEFGTLLSRPIVLPIADKNGALFWLNEAAKRGHRQAAELATELQQKWQSEESPATEQQEETPIQAAEHACGPSPPRPVPGADQKQYAATHGALWAYHTKCINSWLRAHGYAVPQF